jgi:hypothetical protein
LKTVSGFIETLGLVKMQSKIPIQNRLVPNKQYKHLGDAVALLKVIADDQQPSQK